jgi:alginate O-acetyltransferase complex protein AlgJ
MFVTGIAALLASAALAARTPAEDAARAAAIQSAIAALNQEVQREAGGDWSKWYGQLAVFRADLTEKLDAARGRQAAFKADPSSAPNALLRVDLSPPMYDVPENAAYLVPADAEHFAATRPSVPVFSTVSKWLRQRGIDLIVVPAPRIAEVYPDRIAAGVPPSRIVAPHMRRVLLDLLAADVEVVDLLPAFLRQRDGDPTPLYLLTDGHWSDRAQRIAAAEIGARLKRYSVVEAALAAPARFVATPDEASFPGSLFTSLTPSEQAEIEPRIATTPLTMIKTTGQMRFEGLRFLRPKESDRGAPFQEPGPPFQEPDTSPVVVIGDSFTHYFQLAIKAGTGIDALLSKEINVPVSNVSSAGATTGPIKEFLRRPALVQDRRIVVWIVASATVVSYDSLWDLPPLPQ